MLRIHFNVDYIVTTQIDFPVGHHKNILAYCQFRIPENQKIIKLYFELRIKRKLFEKFKAMVIRNFR